MYTPETTDSPQLQFVRSFIQGYEMRDPNHLAKHWHKDLRRITYPRSLGLPKENREEWLQRITELISLWTSFEKIFHSITEVPGKVIAHTTSKANTSIGMKMIREMIFIAHIVSDEDGSLKIIQFEEFTDSKSYLEFLQGFCGGKSWQRICFICCLMISPLPREYFVYDNQARSGNL